MYDQNLPYALLANVRLLVVNKNKNRILRTKVTHSKMCKLMLGIAGNNLIVVMVLSDILLKFIQSLQIIQVYNFGYIEFI